MDEAGALSGEAFALYEREVRKAVARQQQDNDKLQQYDDELKEVESLLLDLPKKLKHPIMVPMGQHAFFPGHLVHTNELTVNLGAGYYVRVTAQAARGIVQRRRAMTSEALGKGQEQLRALAARIEVSSQNSMWAGGGKEGGQQLMEIRESEEDSDAWLAGVHGGGGGGRLATVEEDEEGMQVGACRGMRGHEGVQISHLARSEWPAQPKTVQHDARPLSSKTHFFLQTHMAAVGWQTVSPQARLRPTAVVF